ncbi:MAG: hypothetical protein FWD15_03915 [Alphaproteobacteria bacterium]|nr:hypothetical protein [Alphaproteobacteria bacterium]
MQKPGQAVVKNEYGKNVSAPKPKKIYLPGWEDADKSLRRNYTSEQLPLSVVEYPALSSPRELYVLLEFQDDNGVGMLSSRTSGHIISKKRFTSKKRYDEYVGEMAKIGLEHRLTKHIEGQHPSEIYRESAFLLNWTRQRLMDDGAGILYLQVDGYTMRGMSGGVGGGGFYATDPKAIEDTLVRIAYAFAVEPGIVSLQTKKNHFLGMLEVSLRAFDEDPIRGKQCPCHTSFGQRVSRAYNFINLGDGVKQGSFRDVGKDMSIAALYPDLMTLPAPAAPALPAPIVSKKNDQGLQLGRAFHRSGAFSL